MSRFCVVEGTKITLNDKETVPIEKIKVGQEILSFNLNTLQKSQKYDILVKLKTNNFEGFFQEDLVKNVWKNTVEEYYLINNKLKITKDHIVLVKRNNMYYWTKVEQLLLNDYLFTELNIFEKISSIIIVKEPVKVFNLEVNRVFNYFANSYLIHNGAPCSACLACGFTGTGLQFEFVYGIQSAFATSTKVYSTNDSSKYIDFNKRHLNPDNSSVPYYDTSHPLYNSGASVGGGWRIDGGAYDTSSNDSPKVDIKIPDISTDYPLINSAMSNIDSTTDPDSLIWECWWKFDDTASNAGEMKNSLGWLVSYETAWGPAICLNDPRIGNPSTIPSATGLYYLSKSNIGLTPGYGVGRLSSSQTTDSTELGLNNKRLLKVENPSYASAEVSTTNYWQTSGGQNKINTNYVGAFHEASDDGGDNQFNKWIHIIAEWKYKPPADGDPEMIDKTMWLNGNRINYESSIYPSFDGEAGVPSNTDAISIGNYKPGHDGTSYVNANCNGVTINTLRCYVRSNSTDPQSMSNEEATALYNAGINYSIINPSTITITQTTPGGYKYQVPPGYTTATVIVKGAMGSLHSDSNPEADPTGRGAIISGSFTVSAGFYIYYFVGEGDGSNFTSINTSGGGVTRTGSLNLIYNGGGFGANRRDDTDDNTLHGYKGGGCSFIAYSNLSSLVTIDSSPTSSGQLEDFSSDSLKKTILVVSGGGGGQASYDETGDHSSSVNAQGGNGGNAEGNSANSGGSNDIVDWIDGVTGTFIMGTKGDNSLDVDTNYRGGGFPGNKVGPAGGIGGTAIPGYGGGPHSEQAGSFGKAGFDTGPGGDSSESAGLGAGGDAHSTPPGAATILRGGGGGGGIYGGGAGSLGGGGGGGGLSYYKKTDSDVGGTVFNYTQASSGKRDAIHSGNTVIDDPTVSEDDFNGYIQIILT